MKKTYILDTNVLISDPGCIHKFEDNDLIIPILVLEELDRLKSREGEVGRNCREVTRILEELAAGHDMRTGVPLRSGGTLKIMTCPGDMKKVLPPELSHGSSMDNMILGFALQIKDKGTKHIFVSKDINMRVKCASLGIPAEDYKNQRVSDSLDELYTGVKVVMTTEELINEFYMSAGKEIDASKFTAEPLYPNQIVVLKSVAPDGTTLGSALSRCNGKGQLRTLEKYDSVFGLKHRNKEQAFTLALLMDPSVKIVTIAGRAGCGKTLLTLAAGLEQLATIGSRETYKKLIVSRPVLPVGKDVGFLPGTLEEKMEPWLAPIRDNLEFLLSSSSSGRKIASRRKKTDDSGHGFKDPYLDLAYQNGLIEMEAISFIRGRSIPNAFIIIDEAQNLSLHELKTIITRVGDGTKIVLTGDIEQIDNNHVDSFTNGLTHAIERFKEHEIAGHITLIKGERSELASLASKIL
jgi:PhoH-like ATPase